MAIQLSPIGTFKTGFFDESAAEINAYDPGSQRLFVVNANDVTIDVLDLSDPTSPSRIGQLDASAFGDSANSVAVNGEGLVAVAFSADPKTEPGQVVFFNANEANFAAPTAISAVEVGALPDAVTFTPDGTKVLVANEGEPDGAVDPQGSVSIIDVATFTAQTADFTAFDAQQAAFVDAGLRIFPGETLSTDVEPEFIAVSADSSQAFVTLQEANAVAVVDIASATITEIQPLGAKDHSQPGNGLDVSDRDDGINIQPQPVFGLYMPDAIATYEAGGQTYYVTANEGDDRGDADSDSDLRGDAIRLKDLGDVITFGRSGLALDESLDAALLEDENLGRLNISTIDGDTDGDGDLDQIFAYGSRSFSIFNADTGELVFDSGDDFETITADVFSDNFNASNDENDPEGRSDNKGPEPEGVAIGEVGGKTYAFVGLERIGGVIVYDITDPANSSFVQYINNRDFSGDPEAGTAGDLGPEGLTFIAAADSPNGTPLLAVSNEVSGSTTLFEISQPESTNFTLELLHAADQEGGIPALDDAPNFSAVLNALRDQDVGEDGTLTLSSGDAIIPGVFFNASDDAFGGAGRADILLQNELGFEAIALGNHEFDLGTGTVSDLITAVVDDPATADVDESYAGTAFPYLSSNLDFSTDENLAGLVVPDAQAPQGNSLAASTVIDVNGEKIGVVGATTPTIDFISSPDDVTVLPEDFDGTPTDAQLDALAAEIQTDVDALLASDSSINKVVLLAHMQQLGIEQALAERLENVDIIVAGGSNTRLTDSDDVLRAGDTSGGTYPIIETGADGNPVAVVNTDGNYKYVGRLVVDFDENGVIIPESYDPTVSGAYATDDAGVAAVGGTVDPEVQAIVDQLRTVINATEGNVFGVSNVYLNGVRGSVRTEETNLGNLTADANLAIAKAADLSVVISLKNGGGIRDDIGRVIVPAGGTGDPERLPNEEIPGVKPEGGISETDIANTLRFNNGLTLLTVTADQLLELVEHSVAESGDGNTPGRFPQISGFSFSVDLTQPAGDRVQSLAIEDADGNDIDVVVQNGEVVGDASRTFRMVTLNFLAGGGDGFPFPAQDDPAANFVELAQEDDAPRTGAAIFASDGSEQDALAEYLAANFTETTPFDIADVGPADDTRIQNLAFRSDAVIDQVVLDFDVEYVGFWGAEGSVTGGFSISEADAADGIASLDELISWSWDWTGNGDVAAFSVSSDSASVTALLPPGGFLLDGENTPIDSNFFDADGLDQGLYETESGDQYIDLGVLIIEDLAAGTFSEGDAAATNGSIVVGDDSTNGGGNGSGTPDEDILLYGNGNILTLVGGSGNDGLYGSDKAETFESGAGDDKIYSNGGADYIDSGSGMDEVWLGGASDAIVVLSEGEGYDFIANYQMGMTTLKGFTESELTLKNGIDGAEIFKGDDKLAVVGWKTVSELTGAFVA